MRLLKFAFKLIEIKKIFIIQYFSPLATFQGLNSHM